MTDDAKLLAEIVALRSEWDSPRWGQHFYGPQARKLACGAVDTLLRMLDELEADFNERLGRVMEPYFAREARLLEEKNRLLGTIIDLQRSMHNAKAAEIEVARLRTVLETMADWPDAAGRKASAALAAGVKPEMGQVDCWETINPDGSVTREWRAKS